MKARCDELDCRGRARVVCWEQKSERVREAVIRCALCACDGCRPAVGEEAQSAATIKRSQWQDQQQGKQKRSGVNSTTVTKRGGQQV